MHVNRDLLIIPLKFARSLKVIEYLKLSVKVLIGIFNVKYSKCNASDVISAEKKIQFNSVQLYECEELKGICFN